VRHYSRRTEEVYVAWIRRLRNDQDQEWIKKVSKTLEQVRAPVARGEVRVSDHGYDELAADHLLALDVIDGLAGAVVVEDYPDYPKGPCVLVLEQRWQRSTDSCSLGYPVGADFTGGRGYRLQPRSGEMGRDVAEEANMSTNSRQETRP
jgi:hypothetical protein